MLMPQRMTINPIVISCFTFVVYISNSVTAQWMKAETKRLNILYNTIIYYIYNQFSCCPCRLNFNKLPPEGVQIRISHGVKVMFYGTQTITYKIIET